MRIACISYRKWALDIYDHIANSTNHTYLIIRSKAQYSKEAILDFKPDIILFYGWSWIVSDKITSRFTCIMLHPSPLPKYRGGSPIQNQILAGETISAVTLFIMVNEMDAGPIIAQKEYSLQGNLNSIFKRITQTGIELTEDNILRTNEILSNQQDSSKATFCKRRKPMDSEISIDELKNQSGKYLYNKIRMLADPYPNAYFITKDGLKLLIKEAEICEI
jgi:methionyl-tRNA formyltransferase